MNLYLFNATDSAATYGIGTYLNELTNALKDTAINIHIVHLHSIRPEFEIVKTGQLEHWYIPEVRNQNTFSGSVPMLEGYYGNVIYLLRLYIKDTANLIFHFNHNLSLLLAKELKAVFDCKTVVAIHYSKWMLALHGNLLKWRSIQLKFEDRRTQFEELLCDTDAYEKSLYREVDSVIALSQHMKYVLETCYQLDPGKISVISNGLLPKNSAETDNYPSLRKKWHLTNNEFIILFVGRLHAVKGLAFLIRAFRRVLDMIPDCRLLIAGSGNFDTCLQEAKSICPKISFTGLLEKQELYELYQMADIGVMPSFHEQCSYVAIEMMMHGLPLIGSTTTGLKEMIVDNETGLHIPVIEHDDRVEIDSSLLATKMQYLLQNPEERKRMGANARKRYEQVYSSDVFRKNMIKFYKSLFLMISRRQTNNNTHTPPVSVVLPVHNCQKYISQAIESILHQTMDDFELIIIDDASTDDTVSIINSYRDKRIKLFKNQHNLGNYPSRNLGMRNAVGKYIAVMDADDVCMTERFEKQVQFMEVNREIGIAASAVRLSTGKEITLPSETAILKVLFFQENYLKHPSLIFRKQLFEKHHLHYDERYRYSADYDLLVRAFRLFPVTAMQDILLTYRIHPGQITSEHRRQQWEFANQIRINQLHYLNIQPTTDEIEIHLSLLQQKKSLTVYSEKDYIGWTEKLITQNNASSCFHPAVFADFLHNLLNQLAKGKNFSVQI